MPETPRYRIDQLLRLACGILKISPDVVLRRASLPASYLSADVKGATAEEYFAIWMAMQETYGNDDMAEKLGVAVAHAPFVPAFFAFSCSPSIRTGINRLSLFKPLVGPLKIVTAERNDCLIMQLRPVNPTLQMPASLAHSEMVLFTELFRTHTATHLTPKEVALPRPELTREGYFECKASKNVVPSLTLTMEDALRPLVSENAEMWSVFEPGLRRQLAEQLAESGIQDRLRNALLEAIPSGDVNSTRVAERMHMSKRSLQRHLQDEGTSFQQILDSTRADLARHYLGQTNTSLDEISYLLGYTSPASFYRAFHNWAGVTPSQYRRSKVRAVA